MTTTAPRWLTLLPLALLAVASMGLLACDDDDDEVEGEVEGVPTTTSTSTGFQSPPEIIDWTLADLGDVVFEVPEWRPGESEQVWLSPDGALRVRFQSEEWQPPMEPESILPEGAVNLDREELSYPWGDGALHTVEVQSGEAAWAYQMHAVFRTETDMLYDWSLSADSREALDVARPVLERMLESVTLVEGD